MNILNKEYESPKEMIEDLYKIARDEKHKDCQLARKLIGKLWDRTFKGLLYRPSEDTWSKEAEEKIKVIFT